MKKLFLIFMLITTLCSGTTQVMAVSGKGTEANPFRIDNADELILLADFPSSYFELTNDIVYTEPWNPIYEFTGELNGNFHSITVSSYTDNSICGLIGNLNGTVKNLSLISDNVCFTSGKCGLVAGICSGNIINCCVSGSVVFGEKDHFSSSVYGGGICGILKGHIKSSFSSINVSLISYGASYSNSNTTEYGGITSCVENEASITNCYNLEKSLYATSSHGNIHYGGISYKNNGLISNCFSAGGQLSYGLHSKYGIAGPTLDGTTDSYFDKTLFGSTETHKYSKSTLAMKMVSTYEGWDFENTWAIDESEENPLNGGYPYLRVFHEEFERPVTISKISTENGNIIIDSKITDTADSNVLHIALYDYLDSLCGYIVIPNERQLKDVFAVYPDNGEAVYAKIFTWNNDLSAVALNEIVDIIR